MLTCRTIFANFSLGRVTDGFIESRNHDLVTDGVPGLFLHVIQRLGCQVVSRALEELCGEVAFASIREEDDDVLASIFWLLSQKGSCVGGCSGTDAYEQTLFAG